MHIMLIDDESDICVYLSTALEDNGHNVTVVDEIDSVISVVQSKMPDLILLDIMMPRRSGISIYSELRSSETFKNIPIVLMSGMAPAKDFLTKEFRNLINNNEIPLPEGFIEKPVQLPELMQLINTLLK